MPWTAMHCPHITTARMYVVKEAQTPIFKSSDVAPQHHPPSFFRSLRFFQAGYEFRAPPARRRAFPAKFPLRVRSEEHTSELQSLMRISYAVFCLKKKNNTKKKTTPSMNNKHRH